MPCLAGRELGRALLLPAHGIAAALDRGAVRDRTGAGHLARYPALIAAQHALLDLRHAALVASQCLLAVRRRVRGSRSAEVARHHHRLRLAGERQQHHQDPSQLWLLRQAFSLLPAGSRGYAWPFALRQLCVIRWNQTAQLGVQRNNGTSRDRPSLHSGISCRAGRPHLAKSTAG